MDVERFVIAFRQSTYRAMPVALRVTFLAFPTVSSLAFKAFRCDDLDANDGLPGPAVMSADLAVICWDAHGAHTPEYRRIQATAYLAILLYPVCVPCLYVVLLWKVRRTPPPLPRPTRLLRACRRSPAKLSDSGSNPDQVRHAIWSGEAAQATKLSKSVTFLTEEYDKNFFFWELVTPLPPRTALEHPRLPPRHTRSRPHGPLVCVAPQVEVLKKLILVGAMSVVMPGEVYQLILAFVIMLCFLVMLMVAKPYKRPEDNMIALGAGFALVMFFFFSLILKCAPPCRIPQPPQPPPYPRRHRHARASPACLVSRFHRSRRLRHLHPVRLRVSLA